ncbi:hypothetical protein ACHAQF_004314 [Verticillium nonalfalfae]
MAKDTVLEGVFAINKPLGMSSAQVIRDCQQHFNPSTLFAPLVQQEISKRLNESGSQFKRRGINKKGARVKMGHGGTLDPLATGVLILGVGSGTKSLQGFLDCTKTYETVVVFGAGTDSYDRTGRILTRRPYDHITREMVEKEMDSFRGKFEQIPPLYSALKMEGKPLYEYAREGKPIPREIIGRDVEVKELELLEWFEPGTHQHHWPTEEAEAAEKNLAEQVWRVEKQQGNARKLTPEEEAADEAAVNKHEDQKKKFEERQDELVRDKPPHKRRKSSSSSSAKHQALMSGALGQLPAAPQHHTGKGANLVPPPTTTAPWSDKGPPAARIRMTVTSGFYVRSFCHDLGTKVGSAAMMAELSRDRQGDFALKQNCLEYDDLAKGEAVWAPQVRELLADWKEKHPDPPQKQDAFRNDRNQIKPRVQQHSGESSKKRQQEEQPEGAKPEKRRKNSSSGDEAPVVKAAPASPKAAEAQAESPQKVNETVQDDESEWDGIKD